MKISSYVKEKGYFLVLSIFFTIIAFLFLYTTHVQSSVIVLLLVLYWMITILTLVIEYARRVPFYREVTHTLESLDQKYLITEMIEEPEFMDGKVFYNNLAIINKSMIDHVNHYKHNQQDYKEYIEMWVHEIKTPIAAAHLILSNNPSIYQASLIEEIDKVEGYVEQALYYARSNTAEKDYLIKAISLQPILAKVIKRHSKTFIYKKIKVEMDHLNVQVFSDSKWLEFIFHQIVANSLAYTEAQGTISIYAKSLKNQVILYIQDTGVGIHAQDIYRVFDKGFTGKNGRTNEKSTGMGLYLCKQLCDKLHLEIAIQSDPHGTCVSIVFPLSDMLSMK